MNECEYDGMPLVIAADGVEMACAACAADIAEHNEECSYCRWMAGELESRL